MNDARSTIVTFGEVKGREMVPVGGFVSLEPILGTQPVALYCLGQRE